MGPAPFSLIDGKMGVEDVAGGEIAGWLSERKSASRGQIPASETKNHVKSRAAGRSLRPVRGVRPPFFIDSKNSSDLRFRDGFAADSPLQR
jgi:hypothetical protein